MKKNLIVALALVFVLGIAGTAFAAANPFVDVPAKHWAYDAVSKLAQAGILDGYGDGTYRGERLATRYEMAQATAKAMARSDKANAQLKALIDKLAVEFAAELNNLGVRVAKLEKNASSIKFSGDSRLRFISNQGSQFDYNGQNANSMWDQRLRVYAEAALNDKAKFYGRLMTNWRDVSTYGTSYEAAVYWDYGFFEWTINPSFKVSIGRHWMQANFNTIWTNGGYDAIQFKFGGPNDNFYGRVAYGDLGTYNGAAGNPASGVATKPVILVDANLKLNKDWTVNGSVFYSTNADKMTSASVSSIDANGNVSGLAYNNGYGYQVYAFGVKGNLNPDFNLTASYFWNALNGSMYSALTDNKTGWMAELWYKGADRMKVGSWGLALNYRDIKPFAIDLAYTSGMLGNSMNNANEIWYGKKGFGFQANYTISKNAVLTFTYETLQANNTWQAIRDTRYLPIYYLQMNVNF